MQDQQSQVRDHVEVRVGCFPDEHPPSVTPATHLGQPGSDPATGWRSYGGQMAVSDSVDRAATAEGEDRSSWATDVALWSALMVPYLVVAAPWYRSGWFPVQDQAVIDMRVADLWSGEPPLLGAFSRYGWSHPGPVFFYVLAPFRLLGADATWMVVASVVLFGAGFATTAVVVRRRFGNGACVAAVVAGMAVAGGGGPFALLVPWNPNLAFAWFGLFLVLCVGVASLGRRADLFAAGFVGSALVQLHVGYVVLVGVPLAVSAWLVLAGQEGAIRGRLRELFSGTVARWWTAGIGLLWLPPVLDQLANGRDGNVWRLAAFFLSDHAVAGEPTGWAFATSILGEVTRIPLIGYGGVGEPRAPNSGDIVPGTPALVLPLVALLVLAVVVTSRRPLDGRAKAVLVAVSAVAAALFAGARVVGERWPYLFVWRYQVVWFAVTVAVVALACDVAARRRPQLRTTVHVLMVSAVVLAGATTIHRGRARPPDGGLLRYESATQLLTEQLVERGPPDGPVTLVRFGGILRGIGDGVLRVTDGEGWKVGMTEDLDFKYGADRVVALGDAGSVWLVTESSTDTTIAEMVAGSVTLAKVTPLEPRSERRLSELQRRALRELRDHGRLDLRHAVGSRFVGFAFAEAGLDLGPGVLRELGALNARVEAASQCRCAVVEVPVTAPHHPAVALELADEKRGP